MSEEKTKKPLNQKQEFVAKKLQKVLFEHSLSLEDKILDLKDNDNDFALHLKSLSNDEFYQLYEYFGIKDGVIKQNQTNLLLARLGLDVLEDDFYEKQPDDKEIN
jgi:hypothetical protein